MNSYKEYSAIKRLMYEYFDFKEDKSYEEFINKLTDILYV